MQPYPRVSEILKGGRELRQLVEMLPPLPRLKPPLQVRREFESDRYLPPFEEVEEKVILAAEHLEKGLGIY